MNENNPKLTVLPEGGVASAAGVYAGGIHAGFRKNPQRLDLALVEFDEPVSAAGVSGADAGTLMCSTLDPDLGRVGKIDQVNTGYLENLMRMDYIPVVATVGIDEDGGYYNVNADVAAGHVAAAIGAHKVIYLTDVDGVYLDFSDKDTLISNMSLREMEDMLASGTVDKGMIPKLESCCYALRAGVFRSHVINGKIPHSLLLELLTDKGVGTTMHSTDEALEYDAHPLGTLASRLAVNN